MRGRRRELLSALRSQLSHANVFVRVKSEVVGAGIGGPVDEVAPIDDCILGTTIHGTGRTVGQSTVALVPSSEFGVLDIHLSATNTSQNVGYNGPVCIQTSGVTGISACKRVWINSDGWFAHPAVACAETHTTIQCISAMNGRQMVENIAWRRAGKQQSEAECIASQHAEQRVNERVDRQSADMLQQANESYEKKFHRPLAERNVFPQTLNFSTTAEALHVVGLEAGSDQLAAPDEPPASAEADADMSLRVHESTINNAAAVALSGMILPEATFQAAMTDLLGQLPERLKSDEKSEPWTIVFARRQPFTVSFADNGFRVTLRARNFYRGDVKKAGMNVTANYKFVQADGVFKAVRQGELEIFPPGFVPNSGQRLPPRLQGERTVLMRRFNKVFEPVLVAKGLTPKGKWAAVGKLEPVELSSSSGWLLVSWRRAAVK